MKRHDTDHLQGACLRLLDDFARLRNLSIADVSTQSQLLDELGKTLHTHRTDPIRLHGFRVQAMFAYIAAALGGCKLITEEDSGIFFDAIGNLTRPDFRLITCENQQFFVEVKNHHTATKPYEFTAAYLLKVTRYAELIGLPLKFAIYWSRWNTWTLVDASRLQKKTPKTKLTFPEALKMNEMGTIGDISIGTIPPLALRFHADTTKPRTVNAKGKIPFTIGKAALYAGGNEITDPVETQLAWLFMFYGKWTDVQNTAHFDNQLLDYTELSVAPEQPTEGQDFEIIGPMSQMITNQYLDSTSDGKNIKSFAPMTNASDFGAIIPADYKGKALHLWRLQQQPNYKDMPAPSEF